MFNDILTGKASLEPTRTVAPYRELAELPAVTHACVSCGQTYQTRAGSAPGRCPTCHVAMVETNARESAAAVHAMNEQAVRAANSQRLLRIAVGVLIAAGVIAFKYGMRTQMREDAAVGAGYSSYSAYEAERDAVYPTDEYSYQIQDIANAMCRCDDLKCGRDVDAQLRVALRSGRPGDDRARASVDQSLRRLGECKARLETGGK